MKALILKNKIQAPNTANCVLSCENEAGTCPVGGQVPASFWTLQFLVSYHQISGAHMFVITYQDILYKKFFQVWIVLIVQKHYFVTLKYVMIIVMKATSHFSCKRYGNL